MYWVWLRGEGFRSFLAGGRRPMLRFVWEVEEQVELGVLVAGLWLLKVCVCIDSGFFFKLDVVVELTSSF